MCWFVCDLLGYICGWLICAVVLLVTLLVVIGFGCCVGLMVVTLIGFDCVYLYFDWWCVLWVLLFYLRVRFILL